MVGFETATAAAGCFALLAAFGGALDAGVLAEPKAHQAPMNAGKPFLRWTMALLALSGGIGLSIEGRVGHPPEILNGFSGR